MERKACGIGRRRLLGRAGAAGGLLALPALWSPRAARFGILGRPAPELDVEWWIDAEGRPTTFDMAEVDGKWVYLKCFQNWCPGCHRYGFPALKKVADAFAGEDRVAVIAVQTVFEGYSVNTREKVREIQLRYALPIKMGHDAGDPNGDGVPETMRRYRTGGTPWVVVIDPAGRVAYNDYHIDAERFIELLMAHLA